MSLAGAALLLGARSADGWRWPRASASRGRRAAAGHLFPIGAERCKRRKPFQLLVTEAKAQQRSGWTPEFWTLRRQSRRCCAIASHCSFCLLVRGAGSQFPQHLVPGNHRAFRIAGGHPPGFRQADHAIVNMQELAWLLVERVFGKDTSASVTGPSPASLENPTFVKRANLRVEPDETKVPSYLVR